MFVLPGDTTPLSAKTFLGKAGGAILQPGGSGFAVPLSALTHHTPSPGEPKALFLLQNAGFQLWLLSCGCAGSWANIPGVELSHHPGAVEGAGLCVPLPPHGNLLEHHQTHWSWMGKSGTLGWGTVGHWNGEQWDTGMGSSGILKWATVGHWDGGQWDPEMGNRSCSGVSRKEEG